ncbi:MAG: anthranilate synthase component I family protein, partial [Planctomycetota bacterium]
AYEAGRYMEELPATTMADIPLPIARFGLYDTVALHDARTNCWTLIGADLGRLSPAPASKHTLEDRLAEWEQMLVLAQNPPPFAPLPPLEADHNMSRDRYINMVCRAKEYIAAGDIFQVNLARRETFPTAERAVKTYLRLRRTNPGAYAAFIAWQDNQGREAALLSASPELFLHLKDKNVVTRPIKGTRPRSNDAVTDHAYKMELASSPKDRAELAMIVDLERNDIGRVCQYGSIRLAQDPSSPAHPYCLETHPTVHHLVANLAGRLDDKYQAIDLLRACFPGGSITGAPKVRAMQIIDELEPTERSVYTGSIGYFGLDGSMMLNIAIRTMILAEQKLHLYAGGGIVADSDPDAEYEETKAKILGLRQALGAVRPETVESATQTCKKDAI